MKKISTLLFLSFCLLGTLAACGGSDPETSETETTQTEVSTPTETTSSSDEKSAASKAVSKAPEEGWKKIEGEGASIWLPESYDGGVPSEDLEFIASRIRDINPDFEQIATMIEQNPEMFSLMAFDSQMGDQPFLTNINIISESLPSALTIESYLDLTKQQLPPQFNVVDEKFLEINNYPSVRLLVEMEMAGAAIKQAVYIVRGEKKAWVITCATSQAEFDTRLSTFEKIANSFVIES